MSKLKEINLAVFIDTGISLKICDALGILSRELSLYNKLAEEFNNIYLFTYGSKDDLVYKKYLKDNVFIIPKNSSLYDYLYELILPFKFRKILTKCAIYKSLQIAGSLAPTISKVLFGHKLVIRSGYIASIHVAKFLRPPMHFRIYIHIVEFISYLLCDRAFIPMKNNYDMLLHKYPFLKKKLVMVNNNIDTDIFKPDVKEKLYDIIYVSNLRRNKNHYVLLQAVADSNLSLCFIGQGPLKKEITEFAKQHNIQLKLIDRIQNDKLPEYYNASRICVFPSRHEGNPKSLLEAMSCELPVIGFDVIGVRDLITHGENGLLSPPDVTGLKSTIRGLLGDPSLQNRIGRQARTYILENFSLTNLAEKEIRIYRELMQ